MHLHVLSLRVAHLHLFFLLLQVSHSSNQAHPLFESNSLHLPPCSRSSSIPTSTPFETVNVDRSVTRGFAGRLNAQGRKTMDGRKCVRSSPRNRGRFKLSDNSTTTSGNMPHINNINYSLLNQWYKLLKAKLLTCIKTIVVYKLGISTNSEYLQNAPPFPTPTQENEYLQNALPVPAPTQKNAAGLFSLPDQQKKSIAMSCHYCPFTHSTPQPPQTTASAAVPALPATPSRLRQQGSIGRGTYPGTSRS